MRSLPLSFDARTLPVSAVSLLMSLTSSSTVLTAVAGRSAIGRAFAAPKPISATSPATELVMARSAPEASERSMLAPFTVARPAMAALMSAATVVAVASKATVPLFDVTVADGEADCRGGAVRVAGRVGNRDFVAVSAREHDLAAGRIRSAVAPTAVLILPATAASVSVSARVTETVVAPPTVMSTLPAVPAVRVAPPVPVNVEAARVASPWMFTVVPLMSMAPPANVVKSALAPVMVVGVAAPDTVFRSMSTPVVPIAPPLSVSVFAALVPMVAESIV